MHKELYTLYNMLYVLYVRSTLKCFNQHVKISLSQTGRLRQTHTALVDVSRIWSEHGQDVNATMLHYLCSRASIVPVKSKLSPGWREHETRLFVSQLKHPSLCVCCKWYTLKNSATRAFKGRTGVALSQGKVQLDAGFCAGLILWISRIGMRPQHTHTSRKPNFTRT